MLINVLPEQNMSMGKGTTARMHIQPPSLGRCLSSPRQRGLEGQWGIPILTLLIFRQYAGSSCTYWDSFLVMNFCHPSRHLNLKIPASVPSPRTYQSILICFVPCPLPFMKSLLAHPLAIKTDFQKYRASSVWFQQAKPDYIIVLPQGLPCIKSEEPFHWNRCCLGNLGR